MRKRTGVLYFKVPQYLEAYNKLWLEFRNEENTIGTHRNSWKRLQEALRSKSRAITQLPPCPQPSLSIAPSPPSPPHESLPANIGSPTIPSNENLTQLDDTSGKFGLRNTVLLCVEEGIASSGKGETTHHHPSSGGYRPWLQF